MWRSITLVLIILTSHTGMAKTEARIFNDSNQTAFCFNSTKNGCVEVTETAPFSHCVGDAMGNMAVVYKVPDHTHFTCGDGHCHANGPKSVAIYHAARFKKGAHHYGKMPMHIFLKIMGNQNLCEPDGLEIDPKDFPEDAISSWP